MKSSTKNVKQLKGDGLRVTMELNDLKLIIFGDGCRVTVVKNCGIIRIVGDGCLLKVNCNEGDIEYKGDGGRICLGVGSRIESVSYVGDGGKISVRRGSDDKRSSNQGNEKVKKKSCDDDDDDVESRFTVSDSEEIVEMKLENMANEIRERNLEKEVNEGKKNKKTTADEEKYVRIDSQRSKTTVVTKVSNINRSPVNIDNNYLIKHLFRSPPLIIRNFKIESESR